MVLPILLYQVCGGCFVRPVFGTDEHEKSRVLQAYESIGNTIVQLHGQGCSGLIATVGLMRRQK